MSAIPTTADATPAGLDATVASRVVKEGYGDGAWHGPDLRAALAEVTPDQAFWRPGPGRHNIAEITMHHAWFVRAVIEQLTGTPAEPFPVAGEDWFELSAGGAPDWAQIADAVDRLQGRLAAVVDDIGGGRIESPLPDAERLGLVLGITCHAVYHAGQVQLIKVLHGA